MDPSEMRRRFDEAVAAALMDKRADNNSYLSAEDYVGKIERVRAAETTLKTKGSKKSNADYRLVKKYGVLIVNGYEKLIRPVRNPSENILFYVKNEELFDILHTTHSSIGHGGRDRMLNEVKKRYCNITIAAVMMYLKLCQQCQKKSTFQKKNIALKQMVHSSFNSRGHLDVIDMQSHAYNDFRFIMVYQDHPTKFIVLKALKTKRSAEIAFNLLDIYTIFGAPAILYSSDNGGDLVNRVLDELHAMWDDIKIVCGNSQRFQQHGYVDKANRDVEEMVSSWLAESMDWPTALKFIQFQKNRTFLSDIGRSPYEAMFGYPPRVGIVSLGVAHNEIFNVNSEDDLEVVLREYESDVDELNKWKNGMNPESNVTELVSVDKPRSSNIIPVHELSSTERGASESIGDPQSENTATTWHPHLSEPRGIVLNYQKRGHDHECLEKQVTKMIKLPRSKFPPMEIGSFVSLSIPNIDCTRDNSHDLFASVVEVDDDFYTLDMTSNILKKEYT